MDVLKECDLLLRLPVAEKVGVDRPGGDGVDVDASRAEVLRERTGYLLAANLPATVLHHFHLQYLEQRGQRACHELQARETQGRNGRSRHQMK